MTEPGIIEVSVQVAASPEDAFRYVTDPARHVQCMGSQATLQPAPGGTYRDQMAGGFAAVGTFTQAGPPRRPARAGNPATTG